MLQSLILFVCVLLALALTGFFVWTLWVLQRQKAVWRGFAKDNGLRVTPQAFMDPPTVSGLYRDHAISLLASAFARPDGRGGVRKRTGFEVTVPGAPPVEGVLASGTMVALANDPALDLGREIAMKHKHWSTDWVARARDEDAMRAYLTPRRLDALTGLMRTPNAWVILIMRGEDILLRIDTPDPLDDRARLDRAARTMLATARVLTPDDAPQEAQEAPEMAQEGSETVPEAPGDAAESTPEQKPTA